MKREEGELRVRWKRMGGVDRDLRKESFCGAEREELVEEREKERRGRDEMVE